MPNEIPPKIKREVITHWLNAISRDDIATKNQIARRSVSNIINAVKTQEIPDIDLLRAVAVELKRNGLTLITLARSIRLRKMFDKLHLPEEKLKNCWNTCQSSFIGMKIEISKTSISNWS